MASFQSQPFWEDRVFGLLCIAFICIALVAFAKVVFVSRNWGDIALLGGLVLAGLEFFRRWRTIAALQGHAHKNGLDANWFKQASRVFSMRSPVAVTRRSDNADSSHN